LKRAMREEVITVGCNATDDIGHISRNVGHQRRKLQQQKHKEAHHVIRYAFHHCPALDGAAMFGVTMRHVRDTSLTVAACSYRIAHNWAIEDDRLPGGCTLAMEIAVVHVEDTLWLRIRIV
jgi:hypothetical protein